MPTYKPDEVETWTAEAHDKDCNVIKCDKCDKPAGIFYYGMESRVSLCSKHGPYADNLKATLIYKLPDGKQQEITSDEDGNMKIRIIEKYGD